jgi:hypothetical protein
MSLRIRRGTEAQRTTKTFDMGEIVYTTDTKKLYVGDGITAGGVNVLASMAGAGVIYNGTTQQLDFNPSGLNSGQISEGTNKYFTTPRAQDAIGSLISAGTQSGITVTYDGTNHALNFVATGSGIANVQADSAPTLGGNLNLNGHNIIGTSPTSIQAGTITANTLLATNLGGNLNLNAHSIQGSGNINITGDLSVTGSFSNIGTRTSMFSSNTPGERLNILAVTDGTLLDLANVSFKVSRGTIASPTANQPGDFLGGYTIDGYGAGAYKSVASMVGQFDATATLSDSAPATNLVFLNGNNAGNYNQTIIDYKGNLTVGGGYIAGGNGANTGYFQVGQYADANHYPGGSANVAVTAVKGMVVFDNSANKLATYNGSTWGTVVTNGSSALFADGTNTNPGIGFTTDGGQDTGFFHPGDGVIAITVNAVERARFDSGGFRTTGFSKVGSFAGSGAFPNPPEAGMIIFDSNTTHFYGYNGTTWKQLDN